MRYLYTRPMHEPCLGSTVLMYVIFFGVRCHWTHAGEPTLCFQACIILTIRSWDACMHACFNCVHMVHVSVVLTSKVNTTTYACSNRTQHNSRVRASAVRTGLVPQPALFLHMSPSAKEVRGAAILGMRLEAVGTVVTEGRCGGIMPSRVVLAADV